MENKRTRSRGSVLLLALFLMVILFFSGVTFHRLLPTELHAFNAIHNQMQASYVARAGAEHLLSLAETKSKRSYSDSGRLGDWSWKGKATRERGRLRLQVQALDVQRVRKAELEAYAVNTPFSAWALLVDRASPVASFDPLSPTVEGRVHFNSALRIRGMGANFYRRERPLFTGIVSTSEPVADKIEGDGVRYARRDGRGWVPLEARPYDAEGNTIPARYAKIFSRGRSALKMGVRSLRMIDPYESLLEDVAGGAIPNKPVWLATEGNELVGGLYIKGQVSRLELSPLAGVARTTHWVMADGAEYKLVEALFGDVQDLEGRRLGRDRSALLTLRDGEVEEFRELRGVTNGIVFVDGAIESLEGRNRGARTLVCRGKVGISSNLGRTDVVKWGNPSVSSGDNFGLIAQSLEVSFSSRERRRVLYGSFYLYPDGLSVKNERPGRVALDVVGSLQVSEIRSDSALGDLALKVVEDPHQARQPTPSYPVSDRYHLAEWNLTHPQP